MSNSVFIGNVAYSSIEEDIKSICGNVKSVKMINDRETGRFKGFCFVELGSNDEAINLVEKLNGYELDGRALKVDVAKPRPPRR